jgi:hypothetical protein
MSSNAVNIITPEAACGQEQRAELFRKLRVI